MNKRNAIITGVVVLLVVVAAWACFRTDPVVAEMQQIRDQMFENRELSDEERRAQWDNFRQRMDSLTEAQRNAVFESGHDRFQRFGQERMDEFFQLPPDQQKQRLDEIIDRMRERQQNPGADRGRGGPGGGGWGGGRNMTEAQRDQRRKEMISRTDPKMRAQFNQFRQMLGDRMKERGLPPMEGGRGGGPWRG